MATFILVHSPLVGPFTWTLVAYELRRKGYNAIVPRLQTDAAAGIPYWRQHSLSVGSLPRLPSDEPLILAAHSGAGMLLPAVRQAIERPIAAYIFVDAGIPRDGMSRLDLFANRQEVEQFRQAAVDGMLPAWTDENLREAIPDAAIRRQFVAELEPLPLAVYEEPIPVFEGWPDAPCAYLRFTGTDPSAYEEPVRRAKREGWACAELDGGHFHMLVDPWTVVEALTNLTGEMGIP